MCPCQRRRPMPPPASTLRHHLRRPLYRGPTRHAGQNTVQEVNESAAAELVAPVTACGHRPHGAVASGASDDNCFGCHLLLRTVSPASACTTIAQSAICSTTRAEPAGSMASGTAGTHLRPGIGERRRGSDCRRRSCPEPRMGPPRGDELRRLRLWLRLRLRLRFWLRLLLRLIAVFHFCSDLIPSSTTAIPVAVVALVAHSAPQTTPAVLLTAGTTYRRRYEYRYYYSNYLPVLLARSTSTAAWYYSYCSWYYRWYWYTGTAVAKLSQTSCIQT